MIRTTLLFHVLIHLIISVFQTDPTISLLVDINRFKVFRGLKALHEFALRVQDIYSIYICGTVCNKDASSMISAYINWCKSILSITSELEPEPVL